MKFIKNTTYYTGTVYEWNLPAGHSCPFAKECLVMVDRETGKFNNMSGAFRCYAASAERFPAVRAHRWRNFEFVKAENIPVVPKECKAVRIHSSGDFFSLGYFDMWLDICHLLPDVEFWAFTKSIPYWIKRIDSIPDNLVLTASYGGVHDDMIKEYGLKNTKVITSKEALPLSKGLFIDTNDDLARIPRDSFYLLDNNRRLA